MRVLLLVTITLCISACGWQLRGTQAEQAPLPAVRVVSDDSYSPMVRTLRDTLQQQRQSAESGVVYTLRLLREDVDRRPVTYTASGTPAQYEMTVRLTYGIHGPNVSEEASLPRTTAAHRIFDFDARNVVAKSEEERVLLQQMRQQLAQRIANEISMQYNNIAGGGQTGEGHNDNH
jgi:LPS-assembly lipoprotein